jgi:hypothetical protein
LANYSLKNDLFYRIIFLALISLNFALFGNPIYGTTDDNILSGLVSGTYTGERETRLIFIRPIIGYFMFVGQTITPGFQFYSIFLLILIIVAISMYGNILSRSVKSRKAQLILNLFWFILAVPTVIWFTLTPTYTATSIIVTSFSLLSLTVLITSKDIFSNYEVFFTSLLLSLGLLIRPEGALGALILISPTIIYFVYQKKYIDKKLISYAILIVMIFIAIDLNLQSKGNTEEWKIYDNWNSYRHQIQHRVAEDSLLDLREDISWSIPEYHLFMDLAFGDEDVFNSTWIKPAFDSTKSTRGISGVLNANIDKTLKDLIILLLNYYQVLIFQVIFMFWIFVNKSRPWLEKLSILILSWIPILAAIYFTVATLHTPERSMYPILLLPAILSLVLWSIKEYPSNTRVDVITYSVAGFFAIISIIFSDNGISNEIKTNFKNKESADRIALSMKKYSKDAVFIGPGNTEIYDVSNPYFDPAQSIRPKMITVGNWDTFSPHWYKRNRLLGVGERSVYKALFQENNYWLSNQFPDTAYMVELFMKENGFPMINRENVFEFQEGQMLFKYLPK